MVKFTIGGMMEKYAALKRDLHNREAVAIAFSGGVDSTFLLKTAHDILKDRVLAVTAHSPGFPVRERKAASEFTKEHKIKHIVFETNELDIKGFAENSPERCYICKFALFNEIINKARAENIFYIAEGSNADDDNDYRPGMRALQELGVYSPLKEAGFLKDEIRELSKREELPVFDKPSFACLYTRFPYGEEITFEKLEMVSHAEQFLLDLGFRQVRVRCHGKLARIEIGSDELKTLFEIKPISSEIREAIHLKFKEIGFTYTSIDIIGYRTGSLNEVLCD